MRMLRLLIVTPLAHWVRVQAPRAALRRFAPFGPQRQTEGRVFVVRHNPEAEFARGYDQISRVPGEPRYVHAMFFDSGRIDDARPVQRHDAAPAGGNYVGSHNDQGFRSSIAWLYTLAVYAS